MMMDQAFQLIRDTQGVPEQVPFHSIKPLGIDARIHHGIIRLPHQETLEPKGPEEIQGLGQVVGKPGLEEPTILEGTDACLSVGLRDAGFEGEATNPVDDRKQAALFDIQSTLAALSIRLETRQES
jgi:hypothetical protein